MKIDDLEERVEVHSIAPDPVRPRSGGGRPILLGGAPRERQGPPGSAEAPKRADRFEPASGYPAEVQLDVERYLWRTCDGVEHPNFPEIARRVVEIARGDPLRPDDGIEGVASVAPPTLGLDPVAVLREADLP